MGSQFQYQVSQFLCFGPEETAYHGAGMWQSRVAHLLGAGKQKGEGLRKDTPQGLLPPTRPRPLHTVPTPSQWAVEL